MKKLILYGIWFFFYILCLVLGYTVPQETQGVQRMALTVIAVAFFVPGFLLSATAHREKDKKTLKTVGLISGISLGLTVFVLLLNVVSALWPEAVGAFLYQLLILVSVPMVTGGSWLFSLFLWACLMFFSLLSSKKQDSTGGGMGFSTQNGR